MFVLKSSMIPRIIHYGWFGKKEKSELILQCIKSWEKNLQNYEYVEWNEDNFDINFNEYTQLAYEFGKYAFVSDVARTFAIHEYGGIYLDTDVELKSSLDPFLVHRAFSGFEQPGYPFTSVWGSEKRHLWPERVLKSYENRKFDLDLMTTINQSVSDLLVEEFDIDRNLDKYQEGREGVVIYPSSTFCLDLPLNVATHHFGASWLAEPASVTGNWKYRINSQWRSNEFVNYIQDEDLGGVLINVIRTIGMRKILKAVMAVVSKKVIVLTIRGIHILSLGKLKKKTYKP